MSKEPTIQQRLRDAAKNIVVLNENRGYSVIMKTAADEIDGLKDILRKFAKIVDNISDIDVELVNMLDQDDARSLGIVLAENGEAIVTLGDCIDAREAVS